MELTEERIREIVREEIEAWWESLYKRKQDVHYPTSFG